MHEGDAFQQKLFWKSRCHLLTDWSGNGPADQFWQVESGCPKKYKFQGGFLEAYQIVSKFYF